MTEKDAHIASVFDRDLESIQAQIVKMGGIVESMILDAARALDERDEELAAKVRDTDKRVDEMEEAINHEAARIIALRAPIASDLRSVLSVIKMSSNLERVGDYAKNLAKRTTVLVRMQPVDGAARSIRRMAEVTETHMMEDPRNITACMHLHFIAKNIERIGDHITSIAEQVVYLVTGDLPEEGREKGDRTPFVAR